jgi:hypothetical protein
VPPTSVRRLRTAAVLFALLGAASGCGSSHPKPAAFAATHVTFDDSSFASVVCPKAHALANCFSGTGSATLAPLGKISIARTVISGDQKRSVPSGCDAADTVGTLTGPAGKATISGTGTLCGAVATYSLLVDGGSGSLAKLHLTGTIHNDGGAESWDVVSLTNG